MRSSKIFLLFINIFASKYSKMINRKNPSISIKYK